jgi:hypothetical protein
MDDYKIDEKINLDEAGNIQVCVLETSSFPRFIYHGFQVAHQHLHWHLWDLL